MTVEATYKATYWCTNCHERFERMYPSNSAPDFETCPRCRLLTATRCTYPRKCGTINQN
jgi:hypothetical protein